MRCQRLTTRPPRRWRNGFRARRGHHHRRGRQDGADHRGAGDGRARLLEAGELDGFVRTIRAPKEGTDHIPVFVFHPAGGSTVVYEPLLKRLPPTPRCTASSGSRAPSRRAAEYVPKLLEMQGNGPFILAGWSLGGALAYACAIGLKRAGADVRFVGLIDAVRAGEEPQTKEETRAAGTATRGSPSGRSTSRSRRSRTSSSRNSTTRAR